MEIRVERFLHFRDREASPGEPLLLELPTPASARDVLAHLGIPEQAPKVVLVDGRAYPLDAPLRDGQTVTVFPPLEGG
ncbi:MAG TPA: MoaD/ThiS family protein [Deferrisomatales bacterium]|nr:MoaD/ThiS family protein [Deferrisomatales bacterium]